MVEPVPTIHQLGEGVRRERKGWERKERRGEGEKRGEERKKRRKELLEDEVE